MDKPSLDGGLSSSSSASTYARRSTKRKQRPDKKSSSWSGRRVSSAGDRPLTGRGTEIAETASSQSDEHIAAKILVSLSGAAKRQRTPTPVVTRSVRGLAPAKDDQPTPLGPSKPKTSSSQSSPSGFSSTHDAVVAQHAGSAPHPKDRSNTGTQYYLGGAHYEGQFQRGERHGQGKIIDPTGMVRFEGRFENGGLVEGKKYNTSGAHYVGQFQNWKYHGQGKLIDPTGTVRFEGRFENGGLVEGKRYYTNGSHYVGQFRNWKRHGQGKLIDASGTVRFEGRFENGGLVEGKSFYSDGSHYVGQFQRGERHGQGKLIDANGTVRFEGRFEHDLPVEGG